MKSEFKSRPVYLSREDRIKAHFTTCFLALVIFRYLEKKLNEQYTSSQIIETLKNYNFLLHEGEGYEPTYIYNDLSKDLCMIFNLELNKEILTIKNFNKILKITKK